MYYTPGDRLKEVERRFHCIQPSVSDNLQKSFLQAGYIWSAGPMRCVKWFVFVRLIIILDGEGCWQECCMLTLADACVTKPA